MTIAELMTRNVRACAPTDPLQTAARIMWEQDCGAVPVVGDDGRVVGMVTDRDVCMAAMFRGQPLHQCAVHDVMSHPVVACRAEDPVKQAEESMRAHRIRRLPIVDAEGRLSGILSVNDLVLAAPGAAGQRRGLRPEGVATTLSAISRHRRPDVQAA